MRINFKWRVFQGLMARALDYKLDIEQEDVFTIHVVRAATIHLAVTRIISLKTGSVRSSSKVKQSEFSGHLSKGTVAEPDTVAQIRCFRHVLYYFHYQT